MELSGATVLPLSKVGALYAQIEARESSIANFGSQINFHDQRIGEQQLVFETEINAKEERLRLVNLTEVALVAKRRDVYEPLLSEVQVARSVCAARREEIGDAANIFFQSTDAALDERLPEVLALRDGFMAATRRLHDAQDVARSQIVEAQSVVQSLAREIELRSAASADLAQANAELAATLAAIGTHAKRLESAEKASAILERSLAEKNASEAQARLRLERSETERQNLLERQRDLRAAFRKAQEASERDRGCYQRCTSEMLMPAHEACIAAAELRRKIARLRREHAKDSHTMTREQRLKDTVAKKEAFLHAETQAALFAKMSLVGILESLDRQIASIQGSCNASRGAVQDADTSDEALAVLRSRIEAMEDKLARVNAEMSQSQGSPELQAIREQCTAVVEEADAMRTAHGKQEATMATLTSRRKATEQAAADVEASIKTLQEDQVAKRAMAAAKSAALQAQYGEAEQLAAAERKARLEEDDRHAALDGEIVTLEERLCVMKIEREERDRTMNGAFVAAQKELASFSKRLQKAKRRWRRKKSAPLESFVRDEDVAKHQEALTSLAQSLTT